MSLHLAKPEHEVLYQDLCALMNKHANKLSPQDLLAVAANMLGKLIALQDQRKISPELALQIVSQNIKHGNQQVIKELANKSKGSA